MPPAKIKAPMTGERAPFGVHNEEFAAPRVTRGPLTAPWDPGRSSQPISSADDSNDLLCVNTLKGYSPESTRVSSALGNRLP
jgi:hypothetical protein